MRRSTRSAADPPPGVPQPSLAGVNLLAKKMDYLAATMTDSVERLHAAVLAVRTKDPASSRTARLLRSGRSKMAKKLAEEALEVGIDAMNGDTQAVVRESADLLYNLVVVWVASGIKPADVWKEMTRRERLLGIAEKLPKQPLHAELRRKVVALDSQRVRKRR